MKRPPKQQEALIAFFIAYQNEHGHPPTVRETAAALNLKSAAYVKYVLDVLVRRGEMQHQPGAARGYSLVKMSQPALVQLPVQKGPNIRELLKTYRQACIAAGVDPETGPQTRYESVCAIAEARKRRRLAVGTLRWWQVDWSDPGTCRSDVEYEAFFNLFYAAWRRLHLTRER